MTTPEELEVGRRNLLAHLKRELRDGKAEVYPLDAGTVRDLVEVLEGVRVVASRERLVELLKAELPSAYQFMAWSLVETLTAAGALRVDPPACGAENTRHPEWRWGPCVFTAGHHDHAREDWNSHADKLGRTWNDQPLEEES